MTILDGYPKEYKNFLGQSGGNLIESVGEQMVRHAVFSVLCGENIRDTTEGNTRKRLALSNGALLVMFLKGCLQDGNYIDNLSKLAAVKLKEKGNTKEERWILEWMLGLTDKAVQNILRDDPAELGRYQKELDKVIRQADVKLEKDFDKISGSIKFQGKEVPVSWNFLLRLFLALGAQTLTIRGSEKSTHGKLFEKLVLGALLELIGYKLVEKNAIKAGEDKVFWLSERGRGDREKDATLVYKLQRAIRFDLGFIGRGNTEISLDKVSRFEREIELQGKRIFSKTYIIVDRVGQKSRIQEMAKRIDGCIFMMSKRYWLRDVAKQLGKDTGFVHPITKMKDAELRKYIETGLSRIDFKKFLPIT